MKEIGTEFGISSYSTVSKIIERTRNFSIGPAPGFDLFVHGTNYTAQVFSFIA